MGVALAGGLARGGRLQRLSGLRVWGWWAGLAAFGVQLWVLRGPLRDDSGIAAASLLCGALAALSLVAAVNHLIPGAPLIAAGLALNLTVMLANGGLMPISPEMIGATGRAAPEIGSRVTGSKAVVKAPSETKLEILSDRFWTGLPAPYHIVFSVGDVVLVAGIATLLYRTVTKPTGDDDERGVEGAAPRVAPIASPAD